MCNLNLKGYVSSVCNLNCCVCILNLFRSMCEVCKRCVRVCKRVGCDVYPSVCMGVSSVCILKMCGRMCRGQELTFVMDV